LIYDLLKFLSLYGLSGVRAHIDHLQPDIKGGLPCPVQKLGGALLPYGYKLCHPGTNYIEHYECRGAPRASEASDGGTRMIVSRWQVKVYEVLLRAVARSWYMALQNCHGCSSKSWGAQRRTGAVLGEAKPRPGVAKTPDDPFAGCQGRYDDLSRKAVNN